MFRSPGYEQILESLRLHSIATAELSRLVCRQTSLFDDYAFLCGLLHDVGIAACLITLGTVSRGATPPAWKTVWPSIRAVHGKATVQMGILWSLPDELRLVLRHHHGFATEPQPHPLAAVTVIAEQLAITVGRGFASESCPEALSKALESLGLPAEQLKRLEQPARELVDGLSQ